MVGDARHTRRVKWLVAVVVVAAGAGGWLVVGASGSDAPVVAKAAPAAAAAGTLPPLPTTMRPKVVEPVAGVTGEVADAPVQDPGLSDPGPVPTGAASAGGKPSSGVEGGHASITEATALDNGIAVPPLEGPEAVKQIIEAGNVIARSPYLWGGGHGKWIDKGYDCSGSVSFALAAAGLLDGPLDSGRLARWGEAGPGRWVTIYANAGHVFMEVAGIRFDTSGARVTGSRWQNDGRSTAGFVVRHPAGL
jgi:hypothetical protein